jgi:hypothetical protein
MKIGNADTKDYRFIDSAIKDFRGRCIEVYLIGRNQNVFRFVGYMSDGNKINSEYSTLEEMNASIGQSLYKEIIRDEKLKQIGI